VLTTLLAVVVPVKLDTSIVCVAVGEETSEEIEPNTVVPELEDVVAVKAVVEWFITREKLGVLTVCVNELLSASTLPVERGRYVVFGVDKTRCDVTVIVSFQFGVPVVVLEGCACVGISDDGSEVVHEVVVLE
jgi:hypothetical protein